MKEAETKVKRFCDNIMDYRGEVGFIGEIKYPANRYVILAGERIAQMIIKKNEEAEFIEVKELSETARGAGGFGSTGRA